MKLSHLNKEIEANFLLDTGSQISLLDLDLVKHLELPHEKSQQMFKTVNSSQERDGYFCKPTVNIFDQSIEAAFFSMSGFAFNVKVPERAKLCNMIVHNDLKLSPSFPSYCGNSLKVSGILGADCMHLLGSFNVAEVDKINFVKLKDGCIPFGNISYHFNSLRDCSNYKNKFFTRSKPCTKVRTSNKQNSSYNKLDKLAFMAMNPVSSYPYPLNTVFEDSCVEQGLDNLFTLESIGIPSDKFCAFDDEEISKFENSVELRNGNYLIELPWKTDLISKVPNNFALSKVISKKVYIKNCKDSISEEYSRVFREQLDLGIIEEIPSGFNVSEHVWIPHRAVVKNNHLVSTKVRPVFNCSLKTGGAPSLNEAAFPGTDLMNSLFGLLQHFRTNDYVLLSDITKAFLQIKLKLDSDKNKFSFIVYEEGQYRYFRYNTIIFGFISSPFILNFIIKFHAKSVESSTLKNTISSKFYVDNLILTTNSIEESVESYCKLSKVMRDGGFTLRDWLSNNDEITNSITESDKSKDTCCNVLGYFYDSIKDSISLKCNSLNNEACTKRSILSSISSIFDPLGLFNPFLINTKILMREICQLKVDWDINLPENICNRWKKLCLEFESLRSLTFPRQAIRGNYPVDIIIFCDASSSAFCCSIYAVSNGLSSLIFSKVKIAPIQKKSLPSLELLAVHLGFKCLNEIVSNENFSDIKIKSVKFLTDSQVALAWLLSGKANRKNVFVNNRLKDISLFREKLNDRVQLFSYGYVPSECNISDICTRACKADTFLNMLDIWKYGPKWLKLDEKEWPSGQLGCLPSKYLYKEHLVNAIEIDEPVIDMSSFSSYSSLLKRTQTVIIACSKFQGLRISNEEALSKSFKYLIRTMQSECFSREFEYLSLKDLSDNTVQIPKLVSNLNLFLDSNGIIRSRGRINRSLTSSYDVVNPVIMSPSHHLTNLFIMHAHVDCKHLGLDCTLNYLRQGGVWVLRARQAIKKVLKKCFVCKRFNNPSFKYPSTPELPADRVNFVRPFHSTGVDYTGHFFVKTEAGNSMKTYVLIFTCMNTRAVHLELLDSMNTNSFILAFIRFSNRYGVPKVVYSDNAKTFISASQILNEIITSEEFENEFRTLNISFRNIPTYSPWVGSCWERLIKTVKNCIYKTVGRRSVDYFSLITTLSDIQLVINNRPLTYRTSDNEINVLTPNHLINAGSSFPSLIIDENLTNLPLEEETHRTNLLNSIELRDVLLDKFRGLWQNNYLLSLRTNHRFSYPNKFENSPYLKVGSIVLLRNPNKPRVFWTLVRIEKIVDSIDNFVRFVKIKKPDGTVVTTSVLNLYPMELDVAFESSDPSVDISSDLDDGHYESVSGDDVCEVEDALSNENSCTSRDENAAGSFVGGRYAEGSTVADSSSECSGGAVRRPLRRAAVEFKNKLGSWIKNRRI